MTLSLCMIVRDEAALIGECLRSIRTLVDEAIVVDTGSTDGTAELAAEHGARVVPFEWTDDYAAARNRSLAEATGDWILTLDADERLYPRRFEAVRRLMANPRAQAIQVFIRTYTDDSTLLNWQPSNPELPESRGFCGYYDMPQVRLFRRREGVQYEGIVHETIAPSLERLGVPIYRADVLIHRYKQSRPLEQRLARNRLILELSRRRSDCYSDDAEVWRQHAMAALELHEHDEAAAALRRALDLAPDRRGLYFLLGTLLTRNGQAEDACRLYRGALDRFPDEPELVQALGEALLAAGRMADAHDAFARSLELDPYLYRSLIGLGAIAMEEDRSEAAIEYFERAKSIHPELDVPHVNLGSLYLRLGRTDKALAELRRAFAANPKRWQSLAGIGAILFQTGHYEESRDWYLRATEADDCAPEVFAKLCACCTALGRRDEARQWAEKAAAANPAFATLRSLVAQ